LKEELYTSKFYVSKKGDKEVCFKLGFEVEAIGNNKEFYSVEIWAIIDYQYLKNGENIIPNTSKMRNSWKLKYEYNERWNFHSSIMIHPDYRSLGIGTFVINKMLEIALNYVPTGRLVGKLSFVDEEDEDNHKRRDTLYKDLGFIFNDNNTYFSIDEISNLKLRKEFDYIQELSFANVLCQLKKMQYEKETNDKLIKYYRDNSIKADNDIRSKNKLIFSLLIVLALLIINILI
jgi:GNAT superfamily N-acetyltransferase